MKLLFKKRPQKSNDNNMEERKNLFKVKRSLSQTLKISLGLLLLLSILTLGFSFNRLSEANKTSEKFYKVNTKSIMYIDNLSKGSTYNYLGAKLLASEKNLSNKDIIIEKIKANIANNKTNLENYSKLLT